MRSSTTPSTPRRWCSRSCRQSKSRLKASLERGPVGLYREVSYCFFYFRLGTLLLRRQIVDGRIDTHGHSSPVPFKKVHPPGLATQERSIFRPGIVLRGSRYARVRGLPEQREVSGLCACRCRKIRGSGKSIRGRGRGTHPHGEVHPGCLRRAQSCTVEERHASNTRCTVAQRDPKDHSPEKGISRRATRYRQGSRPRRHRKTRKLGQAD